MSTRYAMAAPSYADLKLELERDAAGGHRVRLSFRLASSAADEDFGSRARQPVAFAHAALLAATADPQEYGRILTAALLADERVGRHVGEARAAARAHGIPLRVRLALDPDDAALHGLRWELLQDLDGGFLALSERVLLSRYLRGGDGSPIHLPERADLRALIVIASPRDLARFRLAPLDVPAELDRLTAALGDMPHHVLATGGADSPTLANLLTALRDGCELLIVVAHGTMQDGVPHLWLEQADGTPDQVAASVLAERVAEAQRRPLVAVLAACEGAGRDDGAEPLAALGPRLVAAGIPAVIAMQGRVKLAGDILTFRALRAPDGPRIATQVLREGCLARRARR